MILLLRRLALLAGLLLPALGLQAAQPPQPGEAAQVPRRGANPVLVRALQDHRWTLQAATDAGGAPVEALLPPGARYVLQFDGARLSVSGGCNAMNGDWHLSPRDELRVGRLASTMKACEPALMQADQALAVQLAQPLGVVIVHGAQPTLQLKTAQRHSLVFSGERTERSLYGKPERLFLEVAPQTVPCTSGVQRGQCLQVRERRFDRNGVRVDPPGPWQVFHGGIQGYSHQPGVRNVLRVDRYTRTRVPADASRYLYVLDLVVESEVVSK